MTFKMHFQKVKMCHCFPIFLDVIEIYYSATRKLCIGMFF